jgi:hypothetical protein
MGALAHEPGPDGPSVGSRDGLGSAPMNPLTTEQLILLLVPLILIQLGLMIVALFDLERAERRVRGGSKVVWALIIVFVNIIGPILYFTVGREDA